MKMYFNEDFKSHNAEVNEIIDDLNKNRTESYDRRNTQKRAEAMQAENKKFDELKNLLNKHKGDFAKIDEAIKLSKTDPIVTEEDLNNFNDLMKSDQAFNLDSDDEPKQTVKDTEKKVQDIEKND